MATYSELCRWFGGGGRHVVRVIHLGPHRPPARPHPRWMTGLLPEYIPSFCAYTNARWAPSNMTVVPVTNLKLLNWPANVSTLDGFLAPLNAVAAARGLGLTFRGLRAAFGGSYSYAGLAEAPAILHLPCVRALCGREGSCCEGARNARGGNYWRATSAPQTACATQVSSVGASLRRESSAALTPIADCPPAPRYSDPPFMARALCRHSTCRAESSSACGAAEVGLTQAPTFSVPMKQSARKPHRPGGSRGAPFRLTYCGIVTVTLFVGA